MWPSPHKGRRSSGIGDGSGASIVGWRTTFLAGTALRQEIVERRLRHDFVGENAFHRLSVVGGDSAAR